MPLKNNLKTRRSRQKQQRQTKIKHHKKYTAIETAQHILKKTGSIASSNVSLKRKIFKNVRRLFGSVSKPA
jgi:hypothetical protein